MRIWSFPNRVLYGVGAASELGSELRNMGAKQVLVVTDRGALDAGLVEHVGLSLRRGKVAYEVFAGVSPLAATGEVEDALAAFRDAEADAVVGLGATGSLDAAKLARFLVRCDRSLRELLELAYPPEQAETGQGGTTPRSRPGESVQPRLGKAAPPMAAVPAWGGAGAEVCPRVELRMPSSASHPVALLSRPELRPETAVLDPEIAGYAEPQQRVAASFEALSRSIEGLCVADEHPMAELLAEGAIGQVARAYQAPDGDDGDPRAPGDADRALRVLRAGSLAGLAADAGSGPCRSLARALAARTELTMGVASALLLPAVLDFHRGVVADRLAEVARILGARGDDVDTLAFEAAGGVRALRRGSGLPEGLSEAGVEADAFGELADLAAADLAQHAPILPRPCGREDLLALLRASE